MMLDGERESLETISVLFLIFGTWLRFKRCPVPSIVVAVAHLDRRCQIPFTGRHMSFAPP